MRHHPMQAAASMVGSMAIIGVIDNVIALIARDISLWQFQILRAAMGLPVLVLVTWWMGWRLRPLRLWAVLVRNGLIAVGMLFYFGALAFMPIAQALAGLFVAPIFVLLISVIAFGERVGWLRSIAVLIGFAGVMMVLQPDGESFSALSLMPMLGGFFYAMGSVATQRMCADESTPAMLLGLFSLQAALGVAALIVIGSLSLEVPAGTAGFLVRSWSSPSGMTWAFIALQAFGSLVGVGLLIRAYQLAAPSFAAIFEYSVFVFGPLSAYLIFGQTLQWGQVFGILLIAGTGTVIALRGRS